MILHSCLRIQGSNSLIARFIWISRTRLCIPATFSILRGRSDRPSLVLTFMRYFTHCSSHPRFADAQRQAELMVGTLCTLLLLKEPSPSLLPSSTMSAHVWDAFWTASGVEEGANILAMAESAANIAAVLPYVCSSATLTLHLRKQCWYLAECHST